MAKMSLDELRRLRDSKKAEMRGRESDGKEIHVVVGMGTCGIAAGGKDVLDAFLEGVAESGIADGVVVRQTGCMGLCHSEPTVEVIAPGMPAVIYGNVSSREAAREIIRAHLVGRELVGSMLLDRPAADILKDRG
jgi:NADP-reducing hydrogenase subunit HndB